MADKKKRVRSITSFTLTDAARAKLKAASIKTGLSMSRLVEQMALDLNIDNISISLN